MKCRYCDKKATHYRTVDLDIKGVPLCDDMSCIAKLYVTINNLLYKK